MVQLGMHVGDGLMAWACTLPFGGEKQFPVHVGNNIKQY